MSYGICYMLRFNMKFFGFISKYIYWIFFYCFFVNLSVVIGVDLICSGFLGYNVIFLFIGYGMVNIVKKK